MINWGAVTPIINEYDLVHETFLQASSQIKYHQFLDNDSERRLSRETKFWLASLDAHCATSKPSELAKACVSSLTRGAIGSRARSTGVLCNRVCRT